MHSSSAHFLRKWLLAPPSSYDTIQIASCFALSQSGPHSQSAHFLRKWLLAHVVRVTNSKSLLQASLRRLFNCNPWYHNIIFPLCTQKYHCTMVLITIFSAAISVFLFTISSICALCASDSSAALITTSTASPLMLTTAS